MDERLRMLSAAVERSAASIMITDVDGHIEYVSPAFAELTGYTAAEGLGQNPGILQSGKTPPAVYRSESAERPGRPGG